MEERPLPLAKRAKTTQDEGSTTDMTTGAVAAAMNDHTIMDLLRSLPASVVANYVYPFAVKVIQNREEMIAAVDEYLDEFYSNGDGDDDDNSVKAESWSDEEDGEYTLSDDNEEAEKQDVSSTVSDDRISSGPRHHNSNLEPRGKSDEPQNKKKLLSTPSTPDLSITPLAIGMYLEWKTLPVCLTKSGTARPGVSTKTCPDGTWRMRLVLPECFSGAIFSSPTLPIGTPVARPTSVACFTVAPVLTLMFRNGTWGMRPT
jgi:hypothetical protein